MQDGWFDRLKSVIAEDRRTAKELSLLAGLGQNYVQQMVKRDQPPKVETLDKLLAVLGQEAAAFVRDSIKSTLGTPVTISGTPPKFAGIVQAGEFRPVDEYFNQDPEGVPVFVLPHPRFPKLRQYAWKAVGNSMDLAGIADGMWIVGADAADYIDGVGDIESGDLVVVERTRYQGAERELTVKEIRYYRDRYELIPRSSDPAHQTIVVRHDHSAHDDMEVRVIGVVLTAYTDLYRRNH